MYKKVSNRTSQSVRKNVSMRVQEYEEKYLVDAML